LKLPGRTWFWHNSRPFQPPFADFLASEREFGTPGFHKIAKSVLFWHNAGLDTMCSPALPSSHVNINAADGGSIDVGCFAAAAAARASGRMLRPTSHCSNPGRRHLETVPGVGEASRTLEAPAPNAENDAKQSPTNSLALLVGIHSILSSTRFKGPKTSWNQTGKMQEEVAGNFFHKIHASRWTTEERKPMNHSASA